MDNALVFRHKPPPFRAFAFFTSPKIQKFQPLAIALCLKRLQAEEEEEENEENLGAHKQAHERDPQRQPKHPSNCKSFNPNPNPNRSCKSFISH